MAVSLPLGRSAGSRTRRWRGLSSDELPAGSVPQVRGPPPGPSSHLPLPAPGARVCFWARQGWGSWWPVHRCPGRSRTGPRARLLPGARRSLIGRWWLESASFFPPVLASPSRSPCTPSPAWAPVLTHSEKGPTAGGTWGPYLAGAHPSVPAPGRAARVPTRQDWKFGLMSAAVLLGSREGQARLGWALSAGAADPAPVSLLFPPPPPRPPGSLGRKHAASQLHGLPAQHPPSPARCARAPDPVPLSAVPVLREDLHRDPAPGLHRGV